MDLHATRDGLLPRLLDPLQRPTLVELRHLGVVVIVIGAPNGVAEVVRGLRRGHPGKATDTVRSVARRPDESGWSELTGREAAIASLVGQAMTNQQIAHRLHISPHTVNYHLRQIFRKLAIRSRVHLAQIAQGHEPGRHP